mmetsp:Transcript_21969/g.63012  ORF Transcript_21969/g.63012 Transcript_21969/m.63012 type:complete len:82 (+) Transcript_21969:762-1007(+)
MAAFVRRQSRLSKPRRRGRCSSAASQRRISRISTTCDYEGMDIVRKNLSNVYDENVCNFVIHEREEEGKGREREEAESASK